MVSFYPIGSYSMFLYIYIVEVTWILACMLLTAVKHGKCFYAFIACSSTFISI
jgi:hypothetical protein